MQLTAIVLGISSFSLVLVAITDTATLSLQTPANCGGHVEMICTSRGCTKGYRFQKGGTIVYVLTGPYSGTDPARYSATVTSDKEVQLNITNIQLSDVGTYSCGCGFDTDSTGHTLQYQCKATTCSDEISPAKKLSITADKLYPAPSGPSGIITYLTRWIPGMYTCVSSPTFDSHYRCTWVSTASLPDGNHSYTTTVTTGTQAALVFGSFRIVTVTSPTISNLVPISNNSQVINGVQDIPLTIECVSKGGIPAPTLAWYRSSVNTHPLTQSSATSVQQADGTYTVTLTHRFTPSRTDDRTTFLCRVFYPGATTEASPDPSYASARLYLVYPPTVTVSATTSSPYTITCTAKGYPTEYTYQDWVQIWPGYGRVATIPFNGTTLTFASETYERSGVFECAASNGVAVNGTNQKYMTGNGTLIIEAPPILMEPWPGGERVLIIGRLGQDASTKIKYWSNVNDSFVRCYEVMGGHQLSYPGCNVTEIKTKVILPVYNHLVNETGTLATVKISIKSQEDFTDYDIVVTNRKGQSVVGITIVPEGPPAAPSVRDIIDVTPGQVILTVVPGFHGGYNQTLVVQISTDLTTWINKTSVYIGLDNRPTEVKLDNLKRNALQYVQIFAYNNAGRQISSLEILTFTTAAIPEGDDVPMTESRNINESAVAARDSAHVYLELDRPVVIPDAQNRLNNTALYESTTVLASPEHVYTSLSATPKGDDVPVTESRNINELAVAARDSAHVYLELDRPGVVPRAQNRLNNIALYESTTVLASPEHVYTSLSATTKGDDVSMTESRNINESAVAARDSAHAYLELDRPVAVPGAQNRLNNNALYESTTVLASPEHVYTSLSATPKENVSESLMENY